MAQQFEGKIEFQDIVLRAMEKTLNLGMDEPKRFPHAVEFVRDLMEIYGDDEFYFAISKKGSQKFMKENPGSDQNFKLAKHKFRELVKLFGRSGFIPAKRIEGVLDANVLDIIDEFSNKTN